MKSFLILSFLSLLILGSCNKNRKTYQSNEIQKFTETEFSERIECYGYLDQRDTVYMSLHIQNDTLVTGDLSYSLYGQDSQKGSLKGRFKEDSLFAEFTFTSEGKESVREVFFLDIGKGFLEGSTRSIQKNNKEVFKNKDFELNSDFPLTRMDCR